VELLDARLAIVGFAADGPSAGTQDHANDTTGNLGIIDNQNPKWHWPGYPQETGRSPISDEVVNTFRGLPATF
jgi:hypothetical protein